MRLIRRLRNRKYIKFLKLILKELEGAKLMRRRTNFLGNHYTMIVSNGKHAVGICTIANYIMFKYKGYVKEDARLIKRINKDLNTLTYDPSVYTMRLLFKLNKNTKVNRINYIKKLIEELE